MEGGIDTRRNFFNRMVAKIMQLYLQKEIMEIDNISLKKTFSDFNTFCLYAAKE
jgi:hypothetical protein